MRLSGRDSDRLKITNFHRFLIHEMSRFTREINAN